jgi:hypothetical protein
MLGNINEPGKSMVFHPDMEHNYRNNRKVLFILIARL